MLFFNVLKANISQSLLFPFSLLSSFSEIALYIRSILLLLLIATVLEMNKAWQLFRAESRQLLFCYAKTTFTHIPEHCPAKPTSSLIARVILAWVLPLPLPGMTQTFPKMTEYSAPNQSINPSFGSFMHIKCQLSCIFTFFFQKAMKKHWMHFLSHLLPKTSNSTVLLA